MTLSTAGNVKLLTQLKPGFKSTTNWNKHQSQLTIERKKQYLYYLTDLGFQGVNRLSQFIFF